MIQGQCLCGAIKYQYEAELERLQILLVDTQAGRQ